MLTPSVKRIIIDDRLAALRARDFLRIVAPRSAPKVIHYDGSIPLFDAFSVEQQIDIINQREVPLPCGGSLVFDSTEALVAIDVNSGKFRDAKDSEESAYKTNLEAVDEIARQLRLRDLGGLLVLDLIDMYANRHQREVERKFKEAIKNDRARTKVLRISELGMLEMTRQRMRPSLKRSVYNECPTCIGAGHVLSPESAMLQVMRRLAVALSAKPVTRVELLAHPEMLTSLLNKRRKDLVKLESRTGKKVTCKADTTAGPDHFHLICYNDGGGIVDLDRLPKTAKPQFKRSDEISVADLKEIETLEAESSPPNAPAAKLPEPAASSDTKDIRNEQQKADDDLNPDGTRKRRRRRRGGRGRNRNSENNAENTTDTNDQNNETTSKPSAPSKPAQPPTKPDEPKPVSTGYVGADDTPTKPNTNNPPNTQPETKESDQQPAPTDGPKRRRRRGGRKRKSSTSSATTENKTESTQTKPSDKPTDPPADKPTEQPKEQADSDTDPDKTQRPARKPRRRRSPRKKTATTKSESASSTTDEPSA